MGLNLREKKTPHGQLEHCHFTQTFRGLGIMEMRTRNEDILAKLC